MYNGRVHLVLKYLGFLINKGFKFEFQSFDKYKQFHGPSDTYSFYNEKGCLTLHNLVQRGEWGIFISNEFSNDQYKLISVEVCQADYFKKVHYFTFTWLKELSEILLDEIKGNNTIFNIPVLNDKYKS